MNYRDYQQVIRLTVKNNNSNSISNTSAVTQHRRTPSKCSHNNNSSSVSSPLTSPQLTPVGSTTVKESNYKITKKSSWTSMSSSPRGSSNICIKEKKSRSKAGCLCCRRRKKKCDEVHPKCGGCTRNFLDCVWPETMISTQQQTLNPVRSPASAPSTPSDSDNDISEEEPVSFSLNNNIMVIQDDHLVTKTSQDTSFIVTAIKASSANHIMREQKKPRLSRPISIKSLLN